MNVVEDLDQQEGSAAGSFRRIRVLILASSWPHVRGHEQAANVIVHQIVRWLAAEGDLHVSYACVSDSDVPCPVGAQTDMADLAEHGVNFVRSAVVGSDAPGGVSRLRLVAKAHPRDILAGTSATAQLRTLVERLRPDVLLPVWSEYATAACYGLGVPAVAYYGNPDHKSQLARALFDWRTLRHRWDPRVLLRLAKNLLFVRLLERAHLKVMRSLRQVVDVAANDAEYYARRGVSARYVRNMWPADMIRDWESVRDSREVLRPLKIVGNVGALSATGNTYGLWTLITELLPALKQALGEGRFEVHLFGGRTPHPALQPLLSDPHIRLRGFVDDLDAEILSAPIFLVANNHGPFKVGNTRFLHCWSLGGCAVAFDDCRLAMPEIRHGENALLGRSADEVAGLVARAAQDKDLRRRIGRGGIATLAASFRPESVVKEVAAMLRAAAKAQ